MRGQKQKRGHGVPCLYPDEKQWQKQKQKQRAQHAAPLQEGKSTAEHVKRDLPQIERGAETALRLFTADAETRSG